MTTTHDFDLLGRAIRVVSPDAGTTRTLFDVGDKPVRAWDAKGNALRRVYDALERPLRLHVQGPGEQGEKLVEKTVYRDDAAAESDNLRMRPYLLFDGAGLVTHVRFDFDGNLVESRRQLAPAFDVAPDWSVAAPADEAFVTKVDYDALGRVIARTTPDGSVTLPTYDEAGLLETVAVRVRGAGEATVFVADVDYNARGQREKIVYRDSTGAEGFTTTYEYDEETFRLVGLRTRAGTGGPWLQDLAYEHDPVGNIVEITDRVSYGKPDVAADGRYVYDLLYRLVSAEGREHPGQQPTWEDAQRLDLPLHPNDMQGLRRYEERYVYSRGGDIESMSHGPPSGASDWVRVYHHAPGSHRLARTSARGDPPGALSDTYDHDENGNVVRMPHLREMRWDHANRLSYVDREGGGVVHFAYDGGGERVRKVYVHSGIVEERIYLGGYEIYRRSDGQPGRETLHVTDDRRRIALVETEIPAAGPAGSPG